MSWLDKIIPSIGRSTGKEADKRSSVPEGLWINCPKCKAMLYQPELERNLDVCPKCDHHIRIGARRRIDIFLDRDDREEIAANVLPGDPLKVKDTKRYKDRLSSAQKETHEKEALVVIKGRLESLPVVVAAFEFRFMGGSMGSVVGEKFVRAVDVALQQRIPLICFSTSGGARMQESLLSLMQMAKTAAALERLKQQGIPYVSVMIDPIYGGVAASLSMLGDINIAEPYALVGFAGPNVIRQTVRVTLPEGFQRSEFLLEHGAIDMIVHRHQLRATVARLLGKLTQGRGGFASRMSARAVAPALGTLAQWLSYLEQLHPQLIELGLERVSEVARRLGVARPAARVITVAGTNGKGSTVRFLELLLSAAGQRVGCYTSPHLLHYRERIRIAGEEASDPAICAAFAQIEQARGDISLTYFEFGTLAALLLFAQQPLDILLLEVGLGGRLDAVNLVDADLAIITTIDYDHQEWLGHDLDSIGAEKAGILRAGHPAILGMNPPPPRLLQLAQSLAQPLLRRGVDFDARIVGDQWHYQESGPAVPFTIGPLPLPRLPLDSALCALRALRFLGFELPLPRIAELMATATLAGRFQQLAGRVPIILDVAHNPQSVALLASRLAAEPCAGQTHAVVAIMADKAIEPMLQQLLPRVERWYPAAARTARSAGSGQIVGLLRGLGAAVDQRFDSVTAAIDAAEAAAQPGDRILVFGSFYTVAEALERWQARLDGEGGGHAVAAEPGV